MAKQPMRIVQDQDGVFHKPEDMAPEPRLRKVPVLVIQRDLDAIKDAISLKRAMLRSWTMLPTDGEILTMICEEWMKGESARLSGKGGA